MGEWEWDEGMECWVLTIDGQIWGGVEPLHDGGVIVGWQPVTGEGNILGAACGDVEVAKAIVGREVRMVLYAAG